ncbi:MULTISPECIES: hypothetical protein [Rhizobium]|uniref:Transmembrane protein n=1 Tax=Rhizobium leguminosarum bv. viciae TaxID=387 RepID=A0A8G2MNR8_RHILV|nr:hypothetical protein [Rhizobium leguminosarum]NKK11420.1 hypothetical protein [Rhizobium leguminosarum bv. viciae]NKK25379.1 hypothetical protein [Rhizobium leguminosarum bv. viciae]TBX89055.1 hypothetical protein E0H31_25615 [Rhizobium leguminosarum bv. viciae]TBZ13979.1 hypothetical protein E0H52_25205 [Rhizobium leguminosarum bv. viciae]
MKNAMFAKIYGTVGAALFCFSVNLFWWERTGNILISSGIIPHKDLTNAIFLGQFAITVVGLFVVYLVRVYGRKNLRGLWHSRLPTAFVDIKASDENLGIFLRLVGFICFVLVPAYIGGHFLRYLWSAPVADRRGEVNGLVFHSASLDFLREGTFSGDTRFRLGGIDGVSFYPGLEGPALAILTVVFCVAALLAAVKILKSKSQTTVRG